MNAFRETNGASDGASALPVDDIRGLRVLVIDDEPLIGTVMTRMLHTCCVSVERRAKRALARLESGDHFDRIICDVVMPEMSGHAFFEELERKRPDLVTQIAFMTGGIPADADGRWLARVKRPLLRKPFTRDDLVCVLAPEFGLEGLLAEAPRDVAFVQSLGSRIESK